MTETIPATATPVQDSVRRLHSLLTDNVPYCSGTLPLQPRDSLLYYGKERLGRVYLAGATAGDLDDLERACQPATFGRNQEDVLDESYRKAGKLDVDSFMLGFDPQGAGLVDAVRSALFTGVGDSRGIRVELYKLNVYGKGAFFKSHKDTPRSENMFGSLVVVFPTPHEGGALVLRHGGREWTFDSAAILSDVSLPPSIAFVAFFSDVDHEVMPVTFGHRVTITYNLYFNTSTPESSAATDSLPPSLHMLQPGATNVPALAGVLDEFLADPTFLPNGGALGFGLRHEYPLPKTWSSRDPNPLVALEGLLKGADAALLQACKSHGLSPLFRLVYEEEPSEEPDTEDEVLTISPTLLDRVPDIDWVSAKSMDDVLMTHFGATRMFRVDLFDKPMEEYISESYHSWPNPRKYITPGGDYSYPHKATGRWGRTVTIRAVTVHMLTDVTKANRIKFALPTYGNSAGIGLEYVSVCMIVGVGPAGRRNEVASDCIPPSTLDEGQAQG